MRSTCEFTNRWLLERVVLACSSELSLGGRSALADGHGHALRKWFLLWKGVFGLC